MTDERPDSLAAQAASWVPPWERAAREPDRAKQPAAAEPDISDVDEDAAAEPSAGLDQPDGFPGDGEFPGDDEEAEQVPPELAALPGESGGPATVDAPRELPGEQTPEPTDVSGGSELPLPAAVEEASEDHADPGAPVDGPLPPDGDDAGDVFDVAADDDVSDGDELDLPIAELVPDVDDDEAPPAADESVASAAEPLIALGAGEPAGLAAQEPVVAAGGEPVASASGASVASAGGEPVASAPGSSVAPGAAEASVVSLADETAASAGDATAAPGAGEAAVLDVDDATVRGDAEGGGAAQGGDAGAGPVARARRARAGSGIPAQGRGGAGSGAAGGDPGSRTEENDLDVPAMDDGELRAALEAILLVVDEPVAEMQLAQIMEQPTERVAGMLEDISARYTAAGHGFDLRRAAGGWRLYTRPEYAPYVERFVLDGQSVRLTQAALETLAVVAYKQPVTRSRISAIRGVNCDGVMRTLVTRGLIEECGTESETGAFLYRTTPLFLEKLGLNSVDQLPPLAPFLPDDVEEVLDASG